MTEIVVTFVINAAIQATLVGVVVIALSRMLRRAPARLRFNLVALALFVASAAPIATLWPAKAPLILISPRTAPPVKDSVAQIVTIAYLTGLGLAAARLARSAVRARRLVTKSRALRGAVRVSDDIHSPATVGSCVLIPALLLDSDLFDAAVAHEMAHVRRHDFAINALLEALALPLYFHPAVMFLRRELAEMREIACDEEAARRTSSRHYATALVQLTSLAARRQQLAVGMAGTSIERRIEALRAPLPSRPARCIAVAVTLLLPFALLFACARVSVSPAVAHQSLCGVWKLVPQASDFRAVQPSSFDDYTQWIAQGPRQVAVRQHRVSNGRVEDFKWSVITDGAWRPLRGYPGARGKATWRDGRLTLTMTGPGDHREQAVAYVRSDRLVCEGTTNRGRFTAVFQRED
jgi:beta-lactamase regulating signal transducer with metallopeptidase domain